MNTNQNAFMDIKEIRRARLKEWFSERAIPEKEKSFISQLLSGKASFGEKAARRLERDYAMPSGYLDMELSKSYVSKSGDSVEHYRVDVMDIRASAGPGVIVTGDYIETITAVEFTTEQARQLFGGRISEVIKMITISGDSMAGTINPGDQAFVDVSVNAFNGDGVYVFVFGNTLHVKRLQMMKDKLAVLSDNEKYKPWFIEAGDEDQFHIVAQVLIGQTVEYRRFA